MLSKPGKLASPKVGPKALPRLVATRKTNFPNDEDEDISLAETPLKNILNIKKPTSIITPNEEKIEERSSTPIPTMMDSFANAADMSGEELQDVFISTFKQMPHISDGDFNRQIDDLIRSETKILDDHFPRSLFEEDGPMTVMYDDLLSGIARKDILANRIALVSDTYAIHDSLTKYEEDFKMNNVWNEKHFDDFQLHLSNAHKRSLYEPCRMRQSIFDMIDNRSNTKEEVLAAKMEHVNEELIAQFVQDNFSSIKNKDFYYYILLRLAYPKEYKKLKRELKEAIKAESSNQENVSAVHKGNKPTQQTKPKTEKPIPSSTPQSTKTKDPINTGPIQIKMDDIKRIAELCLDRQSGKLTSKNKVLSQWSNDLKNNNVVKDHLEKKSPLPKAPKVGPKAASPGEVISEDQKELDKRPYLVRLALYISDITKNNLQYYLRDTIIKPRRKFREDVREEEVRSDTDKIIFEQQVYALSVYSQMRDMVQSLMKIIKRADTSLGEEGQNIPQGENNPAGAPLVQPNPPGTFGLSWIKNLSLGGIGSAIKNSGSGVLNFILGRFYSNLSRADWWEFLIDAINLVISVFSHGWTLITTGVNLGSKAWHYAYPPEATDKSKRELTREELAKMANEIVKHKAILEKTSKTFIDQLDTYILILNKMRNLNGTDAGTLRAEIDSKYTSDTPEDIKAKSIMVEMMSKNKDIHGSIEEVLKNAERVQRMKPNIENFDGILKIVESDAYKNLQQGADNLNILLNNPEIEKIVKTGNLEIEVSKIAVASRLFASQISRLKEITRQVDTVWKTIGQTPALVMKFIEATDSEYIVTLSAKHYDTTLMIILRMKQHFQDSLVNEDNKVSRDLTDSEIYGVTLAYNFTNLMLKNLKEANANISSSDREPNEKISPSDINVKNIVDSDVSKMNSKEAVDLMNNLETLLKDRIGLIGGNADKKDIKEGMNNLDKRLSASIEEINRDQLLLLDGYTYALWENVVQNPTKGNELMLKAYQATQDLILGTESGESKVRETIADFEKINKDIERQQRSFANQIKNFRTTCGDVIRELSQKLTFIKGSMDELNSNIVAYESIIDSVRTYLSTETLFYKRSFVLVSGLKDEVSNLLVYTNGILQTYFYPFAQTLQSTFISKSFFYGTLNEDDHVTITKDYFESFKVKPNSQDAPPEGSQSGHFSSMKSFIGETMVSTLSFVGGGVGNFWLSGFPPSSTIFKYITESILQLKTLEAIWKTGFLTYDIVSKVIKSTFIMSQGYSYANAATSYILRFATTINTIGRLVLWDWFGFADDMREAMLNNETYWLYRWGGAIGSIFANLFIWVSAFVEVIIDAIGFGGSYAFKKISDLDKWLDSGKKKSGTGWTVLYGLGKTFTFMALGKSTVWIVMISFVLLMFLGPPIGSMIGFISALAFSCFFKKVLSDPLQEAIKILAPCIAIENARRSLYQTHFKVGTNKSEVTWKDRNTGKIMKMEHRPGDNEQFGHRFSKMWDNLMAEENRVRGDPERAKSNTFSNIASDDPGMYNYIIHLYDTINSDTRFLARTMTTMNSVTKIMVTGLSGIAADCLGYVQANPNYSLDFVMEGTDPLKVTEKVDKFLEELSKKPWLMLAFYGISSREQVEEGYIALDNIAQRSKQNIADFSLHKMSNQVSEVIKMESILYASIETDIRNAEQYFAKNIVKHGIKKNMAANRQFWQPRKTTGEKFETEGEHIIDQNRVRGLGPISRLTTLKDLFLIKHTFPYFGSESAKAKLNTNRQTNTFYDCLIYFLDEKYKVDKKGAKEKKE